MVKNKINYIFIYIFMIFIFVGCEGDPTSPTGIDCIDDCYLNMDAPSLGMDDNGYYHMEFIDGYSQTFSTLSASVGIENQKLGWISNKEILINGVWTNLVNEVSYTNSSGMGHTVLSAWPEFVGDTIKVYCGYWTQDNCHTHFVDSLEVIVEDIE